MWKKFYEDRQPLNLGFSGDRTEHVIWRLNNGNLRGQNAAKVAVIMIGTNNTGHSEQDPTETADGVDRILSTLRARCPDTKVLLLGVFPRGEKPDNRKREINTELNKHLAEFADGERVHFLDLGAAFVEPDGTISKQIMPDFLHLTPGGYQLWAEAMEEKLCELGGWEPVK